MKRRRLEKKLRALGWRLLRHGGKKTEYIPRHADVNEILAKAILKQAEK